MRTWLLLAGAVLCEVSGSLSLKLALDHRWLYSVVVVGYTSSFALLAMVLRQVGLPVEGIGLIIGVDRLLDMVRTAVNITGDATVSCIVGRSEGKLDDGVFSAAHEG